MGPHRLATNLPRWNLGVLRRNARSSKRPLRSCQNCRSKFRLGRAGENNQWYCELCWLLWYKEQADPNCALEYTETCGTCRNASYVQGWHGEDGVWHCQSCWWDFFDCKNSAPAREWFKKKLKQWLSKKQAPSWETYEMPCGYKHFDFIEIGTSNYDTILQAVAGACEGKFWALGLLPRKRPTELRGLSVDMKRHYLSELPTMPNVTKVHAAIDEFDGTGKLHHVPVKAIRQWEKTFMRRGLRWKFTRLQHAHACSSLGPHPALQRVLTDLGLGHLQKRTRIDVFALETLIAKYGVGSIGLLALDCEGRDCAILRSLAKACDMRPELSPQWISFETNGMNDDTDGPGTEEKTVRAWRARGYSVWWGGGYNASGYRDTVLCRDWGHPQ